MIARAACNLPALIALLVVLPFEAAAGSGVVVAVDTSRSLSQSDLDAAAGTIRPLLQRLAADTPAGLVVFNDEVVWMVPMGAAPGEVAAALAEMRPAGSYTVLHDALFVAARDIGGGVILLASDGRDENSATTVEDVARLCASQKVRIVAASLGRRVDDRALRRLALLTDGAFVGPLAGSGTALGQAFDKARTELSTASPATEPQVPAAEPTTVPEEGVVEAEATAARAADDTGQPAASAAGPPSWLLPVLAVVLLLVAAAMLLPRWLRRGRRCDRCGASLEEWEDSCPVCQIKELEEAVDTQPVAETAVPVDTVLDPKVFAKEPLPEGLDKTQVIDEHPAVIVRHKGLPAQSYTLPPGQIFAVGRAPKVNSLQLQDPTVSAQHFKLVPKEGEYYVVDLETTNGTFVNRERVKVRKLKPGDIISVGTTEVEYSPALRRLNQ